MTINVTLNTFLQKKTNKSLVFSVVFDNYQIRTMRCHFGRVSKKQFTIFVHAQVAMSNMPSKVMVGLNCEDE